jgi:hypothetical protein
MSTQKLSGRILFFLIAVALAVAGAAMTAPDAQACCNGGHSDYFSDASHLTLVGQRACCCGTCVWGCGWGDITIFEVDHDGDECNP